jgi:hypothetical protein
LSFPTNALNTDVTFEVIVNGETIKQTIKLTIDSDTFKIVQPILQRDNVSDIFVSDSNIVFKIDDQLYLYENNTVTSLPSVSIESAPKTDSPDVVNPQVYQVSYVPSKIGDSLWAIVVEKSSTTPHYVINIARLNLKTSNAKWLYIENWQDSDSTNEFPVVRYGISSDDSGIICFSGYAYDYNHAIFSQDTPGNLIWIHQTVNGELCKVSNIDVERFSPVVLGVYIYEDLSRIKHYIYACRGRDDGVQIDWVIREIDLSMFTTSWRDYKYALDYLDGSKAYIPVSSSFLFMNNVLYFAHIGRSDRYDYPNLCVFANEKCLNNQWGDVSDKYYLDVCLQFNKEFRLITSYRDITNKVDHIEVFTFDSTNIQQKELFAPPSGAIFGANDKYLYYISLFNDKSYIVTNNFPNSVDMHYLSKGDVSIGAVSLIYASDELYMCENDTLYISEPRFDDDGNVKLYFPARNTNKFSARITGIHPVTSNALGLFFEDGVTLVTSTDVKDAVLSNVTYKAYLYEKTRLPIGCELGSNIVTSYDGQFIYLTTPKGFAALTPEQFLTTNEQKLTFLSDSILKSFERFNDGPVKLYQTKSYILLYKQNDQECLLFDKRYLAWFPWTLPMEIREILTYDGNDYILYDNKIYEFDYNDVDYYDDVDGSHKIPWFIKSQKLHLNAPNYYKKIVSMTFGSAVDNDIDNPIECQMEITNYRKTAHTARKEIVGFKVDLIRTYLKRLRQLTTTEFQYKLESYLDEAIQIPLSLTHITIKYKLAEEVR